MGRVEVCNNNVWGTVCSYKWEAADAKVACKQLGHSAIGAINISGSDVPDGTGQIWWNELRCSGSEDSLFECDSFPIGHHYCTHVGDAGVICRKEYVIMIINI